MGVPEAIRIFSVLQSCDITKTHFKYIFTVLEPQINKKAKFSRYFSELII